MLKQTVKRFSPRPFTNTDRFESRLADAFGGQLRLRWSLKEGCWHIEQSLGNIFAEALPKHFPLDEWYDGMIRVRDGYSLVMRVDANPKRPCPRCGTTLNMPMQKSAEVICPTCRGNRRDGGFVGGYWELGECLIDHLRSCNPGRTIKGLKDTQAKDVDEYNDLRLLREELGLMREMQAGLFDALLEQRPKAGFASLTPHSWRH